MRLVLFIAALTPILASRTEPNGIELVVGAFAHEPDASKGIERRRLRLSSNLKLTKASTVARKLVEFDEDPLSVYEMDPLAGFEDGFGGNREGYNEERTTSPKNLVATESSSGATTSAGGDPTTDGAVDPVTTTEAAAASTTTETATTGAVATTTEAATTTEDDPITTEEPTTEAATTTEAVTTKAPHHHTDAPHGAPHPTPHSAPHTSPHVSPTWQPPTDAPFDDHDTQPTPSPGLPHNINELEQQAEDIIRDRNVKIAASVLGVVGFFLMVCMAASIIDNPDGCCATMCKCFIAIYRCLLYPCRWVCGCTGSRKSAPRARHERIMMEDDSYGYTHDLELT